MTPIPLGWALRKTTWEYKERPEIPAQRRASMSFEWQADPYIRFHGSFVRIHGFQGLGRPRSPYSNFITTLKVKTVNYVMIKEGVVFYLNKGKNSPDE